MNPCSYWVCILSPKTMWFLQLKWGLTFNTFTQPQSISHFSSTRPQWELLKRDRNSKSLISQRDTVNPTGLPRVSDTQTHTHTYCTYMYMHFAIRMSQLTNISGEHHLCKHWQSQKKLLNIIAIPSHPFKSGLSQGNKGRNVWPLELVSGAIERLAAGSDAVN